MSSTSGTADATTTTTTDLERGERTPLLVRTTGDGGAGGELPPLKDMKEDSIKEKAVTGVAGVGCKFLLSSQMEHE